MEEKKKRTSRHTGIGMDFDPKTSKLHNQEAVDKYLASYGFCWSPGIKIEFYPNDVYVSLAPPSKEGVYMHPLVLALGLRLPMTKFIRSALIFYGVTPLSYRWWPGVLFWGLRPLRFVYSRRLSL